MLDIKEIRKNPKRFEKKIQHKDPDAHLGKILDLDEICRSLQSQHDQLKSNQNQISKKIAEMKRNKQDASPILNEMKDLSTQIAKLDLEFKQTEKKRDEALASLPNLAFDDVPISLDPNENVCFKTQGKKPSFSFSPKNHIELNKEFQFFNFESGAKATGSGWTYYQDIGAKIEWALIQYMLDTHRRNGYIHIMPPLVVRSEMMYSSGQLPKFKDQSYQFQEGEDTLYLIPTSEVALNAMHYDCIFEESDLPKRFVSFTPCFRREAGAAGSQERGLIRTHQFNKVELFAFTKPEDSEAMFQEIQKSAEEILQGLNLHYRGMLLVTKDMSFAAAKTVDLEVWLPGQNRYYEVSSVSNCTDFQSRRSKIRYRSGKEKPQLVHTLNGSGLATSRLLVAILENNQQADGSIILPSVLESYLDSSLMHLHPKKEVTS